MEVVHDSFFDTVLARVPGRAAAVQAAAKGRGINIWRVDADHVSIVLRRGHHRRARRDWCWRRFGAAPAGDYAGPEIAHADKSNS